MRHVESIEEFDQIIASGATLVDFFATWCGPCRMLTPILEEIDEEKSFNGTIVKVDTDELPDLCRRYGIQTIPNLLLFKDGKLIDQTVGYMPKEELLNFLNK